MLNTIVTFCFGFFISLGAVCSIALMPRMKTILDKFLQTMTAAMLLSGAIIVWLIFLTTILKI